MSAQIIKDVIEKIENSGKSWIVEVTQGGESLRLWPYDHPCAPGPDARSHLGVFCAMNAWKMAGELNAQGWHFLTGSAKPWKKVESVKSSTKSKSLVDEPDIFYEPREIYNVLASELSLLTAAEIADRSGYKQKVVNNALYCLQELNAIKVHRNRYSVNIGFNPKKSFLASFSA